MGETFYEVLGVSEDADAESIKQAYREKVKDHHPDVSDDDDAAETFKQLTDARDVLTDENRRAQYDRVGHETFVRRYLESNAWDVPGSGREGSDRSGRRRGSRGAGPGSADWTDDGDVSWGQEDEGSNRWASSSSSDGDDASHTDRDAENAENYQRYRAGSSAAGEAGDGNPFGSERRERRKRRRRRSWTDEGRTDAGAGPTGRTGGADPTGGAGGADPTGGAAGRKGGSGSAGDPGPGTADPTGGRAGGTRPGAATGRRSPPGGAEGGWPGAHAAANTYSPTGRDGAVGHDGAFSGGMGHAMREVGPWLAFHFVFLVSAFVTIWLFMTWAADNAALSVPALFVSLLVLGITVFFSILHMVSQVYS